MPKKVGIILVNYKDYARRFLAACRDSLRAQDYPAELVNIYIVDNASSPESVQYLRDTFAGAIILPRIDGNYAAANNLGLQSALKDGCDYLVTVNMDTEMSSGWLSELVKALDNNYRAGIAQSKILLYPKDEAERAAPRLNSLGNKIHFLGFGYTSGYGEPDRVIDGYPEISGYASGCSFIMRAAVFQATGGYNEEFYMYHDDMEISLKARLAGYKIILAPLSVIFHKYEFSRSVGMLYYMERNRYLTLLTFYPARLLFLIALPALIMDFGLILYSIAKGWFGTELKVYAYFCNPVNYFKIDAEKRRLKKLNAVRFSALARNFSGRLEFTEIANPVLKYLVNPCFNIYWQLVKRII